jgi:hypothetical protein
MPHPSVDGALGQTANMFIAMVVIAVSRLVAIAYSAPVSSSAYIRIIR